VERLIEQPVGEGAVLAGETYVGLVHYHLSIYRHYSDVEAEAVPPHIEVEGRITPVGRWDFTELHQRQTELTLRLTDGRALDFWVTDEEGAIRSTGRGLHALPTPPLPSSTDPDADSAA